MTSPLVPNAIPNLVALLSQGKRQPRDTARFAIDEVSDDIASARAQTSTKDPVARVAPYRKLIPAGGPSAGQQYAFDVDLDRCTGCKSCVVACHTLNGLDDDESFRKVGLLHGTTAEQPWMQSVTTACHHCVEPACLEGCPVNAYEKDPLSGIVRHLDDQCIGCQYCVLTCPYDVPRYNDRLGIVRKCDMCSQRLAVGEAPACVQSCPTEAIRIVLVDVSDVRAERDSSRDQSEARAGYDSRDEHSLVPHAPSSSITLPTTRYHARRAMPEGVAAADVSLVRAEHDHRPLVWFLTLTQLACGLALCLAIALLDASGGEPLTESAVQSAALLAALAGVVALGASTYHLGQPLRAWRVVLGVGHSWLSREVVAVGGFVGALVALAVLVLLPAELRAQLPFTADLTLIASLAAAGAGVAGVFTSAMLYIDTKKVFWSPTRTTARFVGTTLVLGSASFLAACAFAGVGLLPTPTSGGLAYPIGAALLAGALLSIGVDAETLRHDTLNWRDPIAAPARVLRSSLWSRWLLRIGLLTSGAVVAPLLLIVALATPDPGATPLVLASLGLAASFAAELIGRSIFFRAAVSARMPGERR